VRSTIMRFGVAWPLSGADCGTRSHSLQLVDDRLPGPIHDPSEGDVDPDERDRRSSAIEEACYLVPMPQPENGATQLRAAGDTQRAVCGQL
jgi:hypothetical protein